MLFSRHLCAYVASMIARLEVFRSVVWVIYVPPSLTSIGFGRFLLSTFYISFRSNFSVAQRPTLGF
ncbi:hypothetical protein GALMADRAFT_255800 [Galerina marginata CBS 339.88]|uniref:Uncharacterized protein n=1 Tax=Galerina marginata (strain CBS 339.88) TaxID=685588 RepID=A0A067SFA9_GALM3|nr:hypothetical protein GALMADRAFT_255800 [Galerina marginata CBS 339.88]